MMMFHISSPLLGRLSANNMFKIATPISDLFENREDAEKIIEVSDCLECREEHSDTQFPKQDLIHFDLSIIHEWSREDRQHIQNLIISKPHLSLATFHLASACAKPILKDRVYYPGGQAYSREELLSNAKKNIRWLHECFGDHLLIGVENNNYYPTLAYQYITEGNFISQIVEENAIFFLFDIAHAGITAHNKGFSYEDYCATLPFQKIIQIHVCKYRVDENSMAYDTHDVPDESIFLEVDRIYQRFPFKYLTVEYYQDTNSLLLVLERARKLKKVFSYG